MNDKEHKDWMTDMNKRIDEQSDKEKDKERRLDVKQAEQDKRLDKLED